MPEVRIDVAKLKAAATADPTLAPVLKNLFPDAFVEKSPYLKFEQYSEKGSPEVILRLEGDPNAIQIRAKEASKFHQRGLFLSPAYTWSIVQDPNGGCNVLVAEKVKKD